MITLKTLPDATAQEVFDLERPDILNKHLEEQ